MQLRFAFLSAFVLIVASHFGLYVSFQYIFPKPQKGPELPSDFKYILTWTETVGPKNIPLHGWAYPGFDGFKDAGCEEHRCYLTNNRSFLGSL